MTNEASMPGDFGAPGLSLTANVTQIVRDRSSPAEQFESSNRKTVLLPRDRDGNPAGVGSGIAIPGIAQTKRATGRAHSFSAVFLSLLLSACAINQPGPFKLDTAKYPTNTQAKGLEALITTSARQSYKFYFGANYHKAFAQSKSGAWAYESNRISPASAIRNALDMCRGYNRNFELEQPCEVVNVNGYWSAEL